MPTRVVPSELKAAFYDTRWWDFDANAPIDGVGPVAFTDRDEPGSATGAEWVPIEEFPYSLVSGVPTWTLTLGSSAVLPTELPDSLYLVAVRYNTEVTAKILSFNSRNGLVRARHRYDKSRAARRTFEVSGSTVVPVSVPDRVPYTSGTVPAVTWAQKPHQRGGWGGTRPWSGSIISVWEWVREPSR